MRTGKLARQVVVFCAIGGLVAPVIGQCGRIFWLFELFSHFRLQNAAALVLCGLGLLVVRRRGLAAVSLAAAALMFASVLPLYRSSNVDFDSTTRFRLVSANVYCFNREFDRLFDFIHDEDADIVVLVEVDEAWAAAIRNLKNEFPHQIIVPRGAFGAAIISRRPFTDLGDICAESGFPVAPAIQFSVGTREATLVAAHPVPPEGARNAVSRNGQLQFFASFAKAQTKSLIIAGDFNCTDWSPVFRDLINESGLRDSRIGFGLQPSWPIQFPLLKIPIDHCLVSTDLAVLDRRTGPDIGSDHLPIICDLAFAK